MPEITDEQLRIRVHHVGGIGNIGTVSRLAVFGDDIEWIAYDAAEENLAATSTLGRRAKMVNACLGKSVGPGKFYVMEQESANTMFQPSPRAAQYTWVTKQGLPFVRNGKTLIWREHHKIAKEVSVEIMTLDRLVETGEVPHVDIVSMDAQGSDRDILIGASSELASTGVAVVSEVLFQELYVGQGFFSDIEDHLRKRQFHFCDFVNRELFNSAPYPMELQGGGAFIVGEALFLREATAFLDDQEAEPALCKNVAQSLKLAAVATVYDQFDYALGIVRALQKKHSLSLDQLASRTSINYIKMLRDLINTADTIEASSPALTYDDGRPYSGGTEGANATPSRSFQLKLRLYSYVLKALVSRVTGLSRRNKRGHYFASISKVFHNHGLIWVAKAHNKRLTMYSFGLSYPPKRGLWGKVGRKLLTLALG